MRSKKTAEGKESHEGKSGNAGRAGARTNRTMFRRRVAQFDDAAIQLAEQAEREARKRGDAFVRAAHYLAAAAAGEAASGVKESGRPEGATSRRRGEPKPKGHFPLPSDVSVSAITNYAVKLAELRGEKVVRRDDLLRALEDVSGPGGGESAGDEGKSPIDTPLAHETASKATYYVVELTGSAADWTDELNRAAMTGWQLEALVPFGSLARAVLARKEPEGR